MADCRKVVCSNVWLFMLMILMFLLTKFHNSIFQIRFSVVTCLCLWHNIWNKWYYQVNGSHNTNGCHLVILVSMKPIKPEILSLSQLFSVTNDMTWTLAMVTYVGLSISLISGQSSGLWYNSTLWTSSLWQWVPAE